MRRAIEIVGVGPILELSIVLSPKIKKRILYLEETLDGTYRLYYNAELIPDFTKVVALKFSNVVGNKLKDAYVTVEGVGLVMALSKASAMDGPLKSIQFEQLEDGTWLMRYSRALITDLSKVTALKVLREE